MNDVERIKRLEERVAVLEAIVARLSRPPAYGNPLPLIGTLSQPFYGQPAWQLAPNRKPQPEAQP
jgi:hypothetical protein